MNVVNLARRPFENLRPVRRLSALMWVVGGLLMCANLWLYWGHLTGFSATRGQLADVRALIDEEADKLDQVESDVAALALDSQNDTVADLNQLIEKRVFPWSLLFDRLEGIVPHEARLLGVRPEGQEIKITSRQRDTRPTNARRGGRRASRARPEEPTGIVDVGLTGVARSDEALLELIDALWSDPAFDKPSLKGERRNPTNEIDFSLNVEFLTKEAARLADEADAGGDGGSQVPPAVAAIDNEDAGAAAPRGDDGPGVVLPSSPAAAPPPAETLPRAAASRDALEAEDDASARTSTVPSTRAVSRTDRASTRSIPSARPRSTSRSRAESPATDTTRAGRSATAPAPHTAPQVPGVVVLPGARSVPQTAPDARPASPTAPEASTPTRQPTDRSSSPRPPTTRTPDPDTPVPPSRNASPGASLGGGVP